METVVKRLHNEGMKIPSSRAIIKDLDQIDTLLASYRAEAGVDEVLIIGGVDQPVGAFDNSQVLELDFAKTWY